MRKAFMMFAAVAALVVGLAACQPKEETEEAPANDTTEVPEETEMDAAE